ncbi:MAG TPA: DUF1232 domain-containing protein [Syntrophomonadaceae bacterium]|nr:DUF1232 domain-containing protein [Syntrophomonadaceae bacterium]
MKQQKAASIQVILAAKEILMFFPNLVKLLFRLVRDPAVSLGDKALLGAAIAYVLSPWDFLPDVIPFVGQLDDLVLIALVIKRMMDSVPYSIIAQHWDGKGELLGLLDSTLSSVVKLLPEGIYSKLLCKSRQDYTDVDYKVEANMGRS